MGSSAESEFGGSSGPLILGVEKKKDFENIDSNYFIIYKLVQRTLELNY